MSEGLGLMGGGVLSFKTNEDNVKIKSEKRSERRTNISETPGAQIGDSHHGIGDVDTGDVDEVILTKKTTDSVMHFPAVLDLSGVNDDCMATRGMIRTKELAVLCEDKSNSEDLLNIFTETKRNHK